MGAPRARGGPQLAYGSTGPPLVCSYLFLDSVPTPHRDSSSGTSDEPGGRSHNRIEELWKSARARKSRRPTLVGQSLWMLEGYSWRLKYQRQLIYESDDATTSWNHNLEKPLNWKQRSFFPVGNPLSKYFVENFSTWNSIFCSYRGAKMKNATSSQLQLKLNRGIDPQSKLLNFFN